MKIDYQIQKLEEAIQNYEKSKRFVESTEEFSWIQCEIKLRKGSHSGEGIFPSSSFHKRLLKYITPEILNNMLEEERLEVETLQQQARNEVNSLLRKL